METFMTKKLLYLIFFFNFVCINTQSIIEQRDLVILLDQGGENVSSNTHIAFTDTLLMLIHQEACPVLFNKSLWQNYIDRITEIKTAIKIPDTDAAQFLQLHTAIIERLHYWYHFFINHSQNPSEIAALAKEQVKDELFSEPGKYKDITIFFDMQCYLMQSEFDSNNYYFFDINEDFFLIIPHRYIEKLINKKNTRLPIKDLEHLTGFSLANTKKIDDFSNPSLVALENSHRSHPVTRAR